MGVPAEGGLERNTHSLLSLCSWHVTGQAPPATRDPPTDVLPECGVAVPLGGWRELQSPSAPGELNRSVGAGSSEGRKRGETPTDCLED